MTPSPHAEPREWRPPDFGVRPATAADVPALVALVNSAYRGDSSRAGWTTEADLLDGVRIDEARMASAIATADQAVLVHERDGAVVACVHVRREAAGGYLGMLTTSPTMQGQGLGRRMIAAAEAWAVAQWQSARMDMTVIALRTELIGWYERRGYASTGLRKPFPYGDERWGVPRRDDLEFVVLRKELARRP